MLNMPTKKYSICNHFAALTFSHHSEYTQSQLLHWRWPHMWYIKVNMPLFRIGTPRFNQLTQLWCLDFKEYKPKWLRIIWLYRWVSAKRCNVFLSLTYWYGVLYLELGVVLYMPHALWEWLSFVSLVTLMFIINPCFPYSPRGRRGRYLQDKMS